MNNEFKPVEACKGNNCNATDGISHSHECFQELSNSIYGVNSEMVIIRKAINAYCEKVGDPRERCIMIVNAADMMDWLLRYDSSKH